MEEIEKKLIAAYLFTITVIGILFASHATPLTGLDERFHFFRAYQIADGQILAHRIDGKEGAWGGCISDKMMKFVNPFFSSQGAGQPASKLVTEQRAKQLEAMDIQDKYCFPFPASAAYSAILYAPSAIGIFAAKQTGAGLEATMFAGRYANLIFYVLMLFACVRVIPVMRIPMLMIMSFPTFLLLSASYSPDPVTNTVTILFIACCLRSALTEQAMRWQILALSVVVGLLKITNVAFLPFVLLVPQKHFTSRVRWISFMAATLTAGTIVAIAWNAHYSWDPASYWNSGGNMAEAKQMLIHQPAEVLRKVISAILIQTPDMFARMFATFGGGPGVYSMNPGRWYCVFAMLIIGATSLISRNKKNLVASAANSFFMMSMSFGSIVLIFLALYIAFSPLHIPVVAGVQGRYFAISLFTLMICINSVIYVVSKKIEKVEKIHSAIGNGTAISALSIAYLMIVTLVSGMAIQHYVTLWY